MQASHCSFSTLHNKHNIRRARKKVLCPNCPICPICLKCPGNEPGKRVVLLWLRSGWVVVASWKGSVVTKQTQNTTTTLPLRNYYATVDRTPVTGTIETNGTNGTNETASFDSP